MNIDARRWGASSGSVTAMTIRKSAAIGVGGEPLVPVDHPLVAVAHGRGAHARRIGAGVVRFGHRERGVDAAVEQRVEPACPSARWVPTSARISALPESGAWQPNT